MPSSRLTRTASGARFPRRNGQMLQLMLSHFTFDGRGVPNLVNRFLMIPLVTGGKTPTDCRRDRTGHLITASLLSAPQSPREPRLRAQPSSGWCKRKTKETVPAWEAYVCIDLQWREKSIFYQNRQRRCTCPLQTGHFLTGSKPDSVGRVTIPTASCNNWQIRVLRV